MPDLFHLWLSGRRITEYTQATTSQMVQVQDGDWDPEILSLIGLPEGCLPRPTPPGTRLGSIREEILGDSTKAVEAADIEAVVPASHDTASAIVGTPLADGWAYISCGTWALIGLELPEPELGPLARRYQFSNEGGFENTITFLKNVSGMWILDSCLEVWRAEGRVGGHEELLAGLGDAVPGGSLLDPDAPCFMGISNMPQTVLGFLHDTGQVVPEDPAEIARTILDSLAIRFAAIIAQLGEATGTTIPGIHIVGGGSQNEYLMQATANATRLPVVAGPVEATALGNVLVQAIGVGTLPDLAAARRWVREQVTLRTFSPRHEAEWAEARAVFEALTS
jgi:rhamnulokinase